MAMFVNDFCRKISESESFRKRSRFLIIPNSQEESELRSFLTSNSFVCEVRISDCITHNNFLPAPSKLLSDLSCKVREVNQAGSIAFILGWDAMQMLWDSSCAKASYGALQQMLDDSGMSFLIFTQSASNEFMQETFQHPRYQEGQIVLHVGTAASSEPVVQTIRLIAKEFQFDPIQGTVISSLKQFVKEYGDGMLVSETVNIFANFNGNRFAGIREEWPQVYSRKQYLKTFCSLDDELPESSIDWLYEQFHEKQGDVAAIVQHRFFPEGINSREALIAAPEKIMREEPIVKEVLLWVLKNNLKEGSYLYAVISDPQLTTDNFATCYVCEALNMLEDSRRDAFAEERKSALGQIGVSLISCELAKFIRQCKEHSVELVAPWLNLGTDLEKCELLRRVITSDWTKIPQCILKVYPLLDAYMQPYQLGFIEINQYFSDYRILKIRDRVTPEFCERAKVVKIPPSGVASRDSLIQSYSKEDDAALLVVDGLGVEYLPLLITLAQKRNLGIFTADAAVTKLPSSTEFNPISWPEDRRLPEIKSIDNNVHNGAELHALKPREEDLAALLDVFDKQILPAVAQAMTRFSTIVLTSDHGATRLAVCANQQGLSKTIPMPENCEISDWRFTKAIPEKTKNAELMENLSGSHWIVKGYDRLPKKGPKLHEMHGGATYEECLVPFIVFKRGATFVPKAQQSQQAGTEFVENSDFDL